MLMEEKMDFKPSLLLLLDVSTNSKVHIQEPLPHLHRGKTVTTAKSVETLNFVTLPMYRLGQTPSDDNFHLQKTKNTQKKEKNGISRYNQK